MDGLPWIGMRFLPSHWRIDSRPERVAERPFANLAITQVRDD